MVVRFNHKEDSNEKLYSVCPKTRVQGFVPCSNFWAGQKDRHKQASGDREP
jgi:hypothetical protein